MWSCSIFTCTFKKQAHTLTRLTPVCDWDEKWDTQNEDLCWTSATALPICLFLCDIGQERLHLQWCPCCGHCRLQPEKPGDKGFRTSEKGCFAVNGTICLFSISVTSSLANKCIYSNKCLNLKPKMSGSELRFSMSSLPSISVSVWAWRWLCHDQVHHIHTEGDGVP